MRSQSIVEIALVLIAFAVIMGALPVALQHRDFEYYKNEMMLTAVLNEEKAGFSNAELILLWDSGELRDDFLRSRLEEAASRTGRHYLIFLNGSKQLVVYDLYDCVRAPNLHVATATIGNVTVYLASWDRGKEVQPC